MLDEPLEVEEQAALYEDIMFEIDSQKSQLDFVSKFIANSESKIIHYNINYVLYYNILINIKFLNNNLYFVLGNNTPFPKLDHYNKLCMEFNNLESSLVLFKNNIKYNFEKKQTTKELNNLKLLFDGYAKWLDGGNCTFEQIKVRVFI